MEVNQTLGPVELHRKFQRQIDDRQEFYVCAFDASDLSGSNLYAMAKPLLDQTLRYLETERLCTNRRNSFSVFARLSFGPWMEASIRNAVWLFIGEGSNRSFLSGSPEQQFQQWLTSLPGFVGIDSGHPSQHDTFLYCYFEPARQTLHVSKPMLAVFLPVNTNLSQQEDGEWTFVGIRSQEGGRWLKDFADGNYSGGIYQGIEDISGYFGGLFEPYLLKLPAETMDKLSRIHKIPGLGYGLSGEILARSKSLEDVERFIANVTKSLGPGVLSPPVKGRKPVPRHPSLEFLLPHLGRVKEPETYEDKLMEFIDSIFTFDGFPGFEAGVVRAVEILEEYGIEPKSLEGQHLLETYVEHVKDGLYGAFRGSAKCQSCGRQFKPAYSPEYANLALAGKVFCPECSSAGMAAKTGDESEENQAPGKSTPERRIKSEVERTISSESAVAYRVVIGDSSDLEAPRYTVRVNPPCTPADLEAYLIERDILLMMMEPAGPPIAHTLTYSGTALQRDVAITEQHVPPDSLLYIRGELVQGEASLTEWLSRRFGRADKVESCSLIPRRRGRRSLRPTVHGTEQPETTPSMSSEEASEQLRKLLEG